MNSISRIWNENMKARIGLAIILMLSVMLVANLVLADDILPGTEIRPYSIAVFEYDNTTKIAVNLYEITGIRANTFMMNATADPEHESNTMLNLVGTVAAGSYAVQIGNISVDILLEDDNGFLYTVNATADQGFLTLDVSDIMIMNVTVSFEYNNTRLNYSGIDIRQVADLMAADINETEVRIIVPAHGAMIGINMPFQVIAEAYGSGNVSGMVAEIILDSQSFELEMHENRQNKTFETDFFNLLHVGTYRLFVSAYRGTEPVAYSESMLEVVHNSRYFELPADESADIGTVDQVSYDTADLNASVRITQPLQGQEFLFNDVIQIASEIRSPEEISEVLAVIEWGEGRIVQQMLDFGGNGLYETDFFNAMDAGEYNVTVVASDASGAQSNTSIIFSVRPEAQGGQRNRLSRTDLVDIVNKGTKKSVEVQMLIADEHIGSVAAYGMEQIYHNKDKIDSLKIRNLTRSVKQIEFFDIRTNGTIELGIEDLDIDGYVQTYAIDPENIEFENATVTVEARGTKLYKCRDWDFDSRQCLGDWVLFMSGLVPGEEYSFVLTPDDPAFGEADANARPDSCIFSDDFGQGDNDQNVDCLIEVNASNNGFTVDMDDYEKSGAGEQAVMYLNFLNSLDIVSVSSVNVTFRYQRSASSSVGSTTAYIQILDSGSYVQACTDSVTIGAWETYVCDLSAYVTTEAELNNVSIRLITDTGPSAPLKEYGRTYVDYVYLTAAYEEPDSTAPWWSDNETYPPSMSYYDPDMIYYFNVTWDDDHGIDTVLIEHNFTGLGLVNDSVSSTGNEYYFTTGLAAGDYQWKYYANDTSGNPASTSVFHYTVLKATPQLQLLLNGSEQNIIINNSGTVNLTGIAAFGEGILELFRGTELLDQGQGHVNKSESFDVIGVYDITVRHNETQNFTQYNKTYTITVQDTIPPGPVIGLDNESSGVSWIRWIWSNPADPDFDHLEIYINGTYKGMYTQESYNATGLNSQTAYEIQVRAVDIHSNKGEYANNTAQTKSSTDSTPPIIFNILNTSITTTSVNISWDTDEIADSGIKYGNESGNYMFEEFDPENVLNHSMIISGLKPSTTYYYVVNSTDIALNSIESGEYSFTTSPDTTAPWWSDNKSHPASPATYDPSTIYSFNVTWSDDVGLDYGSALIENNFTGLLRNDSVSNNSNEYYFTTTLSAGTYSWRYFIQDTSGNPSNTSMFYYTVVKAGSDIMLLLNGTAGDISIDEDTGANLTAAMVLPGQGYLSLYRNGALIQSGSDMITNVSTYPAPGIYNITAAYPGDDNYSGTTVTYWLTVNDTTPPNVTLTYPGNETIDNDGNVVFGYEVQDNGMVANCTLLLNGSPEQTDPDPKEGANSFTVISMDSGFYVWNVACYDTYGNSGSGIERILNVSIQVISINVTATTTSNWDDANAISISDINATDTIVESRVIDRNTQRYITWTNFSTAGVPEGSTITSVHWNAYQSGSTNVLFDGLSWYDGNTYVDTGCAQYYMAGGYVTNTCDLSALVDTVTEANDISVRYRVSTSRNSQSVSIDHFYITINYIESPPPPAVTLNSPGNISYIIDDDATLNYSVSGDYLDFCRIWGDFNGTWAINHTDPSPNVTGPNIYTVPLSPGTYEWNVECFDTWGNSAFADSNWTFTIADSYHVFYGNSSMGVRLGSGGSVLANYGSVQATNIYVYDIDSAFEYANLQAIGRKKDNSASSNDFSEIDAHPGIQTNTDTVSSLWSMDGTAPKNTRTFYVYGRQIDNVPVINSTNSSTFVTGILWDMQDSADEEYDASEDLVFITAYNASMPGKYGTYGYEIKIPGTLGEYSGSTNLVKFQVETQN